MLVLWIFRLICPGFDDLILNPATGKISQKNLFGVLGFYMGAALSATVILVQLSRHESVDTAPLVVLLVQGLGTAGLKVYQTQQNRRTADEAGQPLAVPPPVSEPPEVMPQVENPNAPLIPPT